MDAAASALTDRVKAVWASSMQEVQAGIQAARACCLHEHPNPEQALRILKQPVTPGALRVARAHLVRLDNRELDPAAWWQWGIEAARQHALVTTVVVMSILPLARLDDYPEREAEAVLRTMREACLGEFGRLWPAVAALHLAEPAGPPTPGQRLLGWDLEMQLGGWAAACREAGLVVRLDSTDDGILVTAAVEA